VCEPVTLGILAATAAAAGVAQQQNASNVANEYEKIAYGQRKDNALATFGALRQRELQEREKAAQDIRAVTSQARASQNAARLQALESGTGGQSVDALLSNFERGELANVSIVRTNLANTATQLQNEAYAAGRIQGKQKHLGPLDSGIGIAASTLNVASAGIGTYAASKPPTPVK
jgi:hypothetical protein